MWPLNRQHLPQAGAAIIGLLLSTQSWAGSISASYKGADVTVSYEVDASDPQTVSFEYLFSVGDTTTASEWIGTTMDAFSVQFGSAGNGSNTIIDSISATSTNSANVIGEWVGVLGKVSGNGCTENDSETVCYTREETGQGGNGEGETVIQAENDYSFQFDVMFSDGADLASILDGDRSIKFLSVVQNPSGGWSTGLQLSESGPLIPGGPGPDPDPNPVPVPSVLYLFGLALVSMHFARRRRKV